MCYARRARRVLIDRFAASRLGDVVWLDEDQCSAQDLKAGSEVGGLVLWNNMRIPAQTMLRKCPILDSASPSRALQSDTSALQEAE